MRVSLSLLILFYFNHFGDTARTGYHLSQPSPAATDANAISNPDPDPEDDGDYTVLQGRIIGGFPTSVRNFPHQVSLQQNNAHNCGGAIIRPSVIITAAHCFEQDPPIPVGAYKVRAGSSLHASGGQLVAVRRIIKHAGYSSATHDNDIALVQLVQPLRYTQLVQPVQLAANDANALPAASALLFVSGWGLTSESGQVESLLHYVDVHPIAQATCVQNYQLVLPITAQMFCAGYNGGGKDSCQGDSGGPLVSYRQGVTTLHGIVSWGVGCGQKEYPGVYANVATLRPWIDAQLDGLEARGRA